MIIKNKSRILKETGIEVEIEKVFVRDLTKKRSIDTTHLPLTTNANEITNNEKIDIILECMGGNGENLTKELVINSLRNKKHVIMSSKKALAKNSMNILEEAAKNNLNLKYDASVGGGIPIAKVIEGAFNGDKITGVKGILNATSNFIYSKMLNDNLFYEDALRKAQEKGYAENDPTDDVDGFDSLYKVLIISAFAMRKVINPEKLTRMPFRKIEVKDMEYAGELGYVIKPLAMVRASEDKYEYKVGPCLVPKNNLLANTFDNFNSVIIESEYCCESGFYGQGAGAKPTATAMFDDLVNILKRPEPIKNNYEIINYSKLIDYKSDLYWRFSVKNEIGVLSKFTSVLAKRKINIEKIVQKNTVAGFIEIVLFSSYAAPDVVREIIDEMSKNEIKNETVMAVI
jgi:homoserine dehydrogenase